MWYIYEWNKDGRWTFVGTLKEFKSLKWRNKNIEINEEKLKDNLNKLHVQRSFFRANNKNALCWVVDCVNDNKKVNITTPLTMCSIICHNNPVLNLNPKTQARKGLIIYNTMNGIATLRKHVNSDHFEIIIIFLNKKWIVFWRKKKDNLLKKDQIFLLTPFFFL
jgi:hypothetical protein